mmetsp:Transcript_35665/g.76151  ORF Transcript_35665/g.76151 Transcript_35665/m.76151 type:complete len:200 (+) Transcript_35665:581-1180(+)
MDPSKTDTHSIPDQRRIHGRLHHSKTQTQHPPAVGAARQICRKTGHAPPAHHQPQLSQECHAHYEGVFRLRRHHLHPHEHPGRPHRSLHDGEPPVQQASHGRVQHTQGPTFQEEERRAGAWRDRAHRLHIRHRPAGSALLLPRSPRRGTGEHCKALPQRDDTVGHTRCRELVSEHEKMGQHRDTAGEVLRLLWGAAQWK